MRLRAALAGLMLLAGPAVAQAPALPFGPLTAADYAPVEDTLVPLGRLLFWDPVLSGNRGVSCGTCHHPRFGTGDGLSLGLGDGGVGLGPDRRGDPANLPEQVIPRNAPGLFNLGAREFTVLFHDGRIEVDATRPGGLRTPLGEDMVAGFASLLSAQTMFPVLSPDEMAGHYGENEIARAVRMGRLSGPDGAWALIAARVAAIPAYAEGFAAARPATVREGLAFTDISDAIAAFIAVEWRSDDSPFDRHLRGEAPLTGAALRGMVRFYGESGCAACHAGPFQTDHGFHAMGAPQLGPGKAARFESHRRDVGRMRVTGRAEDAYAFRTPSLRNVTRTGPWGHAGGHVDLGAFLRDHAAPRAAAAEGWRSAVLPKLETGLAPGLQTEIWAVRDTPEEVAAIAAALERPDRAMDPAEVSELLAFLDALTDAGALAGRTGTGIPERVPSGLPVDR